MLRNRWFHIPELHAGSGAEKKATWLELFYDLIFVAAFIQLGNGLVNHVSLAGFATFAGVFTPLWIVWIGFAYYVNLFTVDDFIHRLIVFAQMFAIGAMAISVPAVFDNEPHTFALACGVAQAIIAVLNARVYRHVPAARDYTAYWGGVFGTSAALWLGSVAVPTPWCYAMWGLGSFVVFAAPFNRVSRALLDRFPTDEEHLSERFGLLTIIVLGEAFVKVLSELAGLAEISGGADVERILQACGTLLITCCLWWIYFDDVAGSKTKRQPLAPFVWLFGHLPLQMAIVATGVAVKKAVLFDLGATAPAAYRWFLSGTLALAFAATAIIDSVTERRQAELSDRHRVNVRWASAVLILLLAPAGGGMTAGVYVALVLTMCVAQVVFDLMMAPFEAAPEHAHEEAPTTAELARRAAAGEQVERGRPDPANAVRKGTPPELRRDIYFYFMEGSWRRFFVALGFLYLVVNLFFAALFMLEPGSITATRPDSFADAFYFSVQTFSTIGYGTMSPATDYGHTIVVIEAAVGLLSVALATGFVFAKASRPRASVLFSKPMVVTTMRGKRVLMFRAGNARGNEVVDASMTVTVLKDDVSPEGHHIRRLHDVDLVRARSPVFQLGWTAMHEIDDDSPFAGVDWPHCERDIFAIIVTLIGHDGTYGQTIYARHNYAPEDIRIDQRFVDVISQLPDGRLEVDFGKFHDTVPDAPVSEPA